MIPTIATIVIAAIGVAWAVLGFIKRRSFRAILRGSGLALAAVGLFLIGWIDLTVNGIGSLVAWAQRTAWTQQVTTGAVLAAVGALVFIVAGFAKPGHALEAPAQPQQPGKQVAPSAKKQALPAKGLDPEDAEIEAILKSRGIE